MEYARLMLPADAIGSPTEQGSIIQFRSWHVFHYGAAVGGPETVVWHVHRLPAGIEPPLKVHRALRVGNHFTANASCLVFGYAVHLNLARFAIRRIY